MMIGNPEGLVQLGALADLGAPLHKAASSLLRKRY